MKKIVSLVSALLLILTIFSVSFVSADPGLESGIVGETIFVPEKEQQVTSSDNVSVLANPMGRIDCVATSTGGAICDWRIAAGFKKINYSNVQVIFEKWENFAWKYVSTSNFNYPVNPPKSVIEDQAGIGMLNPGFYRARLGGTFLTVEDGRFVASAETPATFTVPNP